MHHSFRYLATASFFLVGISLQAQSPQYLPGTRGHEINDRWDVLYWKQHDQSQMSSVGNISRKGLIEIAEQSTSLVGKLDQKPVELSSSRDSIKAKLEAIYDGQYEVEGNHKQGIFRIGKGVSQSNGYSKLDAADADYILRDNVEYRQAKYDGISHETQEKRVYDSSGIFYTIESDDEEVRVAKGEESGWNLFNTFYKTPANFYEAHVKNLDIVINPMLHLSGGAAKDDVNTVFRNTRGIEIRGLIADDVYFYTNIVESQARFNNFMERRIAKYRAIPGQGAYKDYESGVIESLTGWDFLNSQAYVGNSFAKGTITAELGHGRHFIGNGIRSLILSDYANNYFYLKFNTRVWKFQYQNIFAELSPISDRFTTSANVLPKKYMANHYLTYAPRRNMEIGIFETVVFSRQDQFELQYLNPVILYRTVEQFLDSPDNVLIGLTGKWNITSGVQLYGQLILDEFNLGELTAGNGWWANKYGLQTGVKYYNVANIDHLDVQVEYNTARPYTYSHRDTLDGFPNQNVASYTHYNQPLAHPLGSNFKELLFEVRYRPVERLFVKARYIKAVYGQDATGTNFGGNPLLPLESREADYGNFTGQGIKTDIGLMRLDVSYEFAHNYFLDFNYLWRSEDAEQDDLDISTNYIGLGLRVNMAQANWDY